MGIYLSVMGSLICLVFAGLSYITYRTEQQNGDRYVNQYLYSPSAIDPDKPEKYQWHEWMDKLAPIGKRIELLSDPVELEDDLIKAGTPYGYGGSAPGSQGVGGPLGFHGVLLYAAWPAFCFRHAPRFDLRRLYGAHVGHSLAGQKETVGNQVRASRFPGHDEHHLAIGNGDGFGP